MSARKSSLFAAAFAGALIFIAGGAPPLQAEEAETAVAPPAARLAALAAARACRIVVPTFAPDAPHDDVQATRYPGGGKLSFAVAAPCPSRLATFDV